MNAKRQCAVPLLKKRIWPRYSGIDHADCLRVKRGTIDNGIADVEGLINLLESLEMWTAVE